MKIRFTLDNKMDADLITRIRQKANNGSTNEAAKFLMRFWCELEQGQTMTYSGQNLTPARPIVSSEDNINEFNLEGLDTIS